MATIIRIKERKAEKLYECAEKLHKGAKKLMQFIEEDIMDSEDYEERDDRSMGMGRGNFRDDDDDDDDYNERRGVPGTGRYGRRRYYRRY